MRDVPITQQQVGIGARVQETGGPTGGANFLNSISKFAGQKAQEYQAQSKENAYIRGQTAIVGQMQEIESKYASDPDGMRTALDEYSNGFLNEVGDPDMRARFELQIKKTGGAAIAQATARRQSIIKQETRLSSMQAIESINRSLPGLVNAFTSQDPSVSLPAMEAVQESLMRVQQIADQTDVNGEYIFTPDQRFRMVNDLKDQVSFQRAIANPDEYKDFIDGSLIVKMPNPGQSTMRTANNLFTDLKKELGLSDAAAAGIVGNLAHESAGFVEMQELNPAVTGSRGGFGFAQWTGSRRDAFEKWASENNLDPKSYEANKGFLIHELKNTSEGAVLKDLEGAGNALEATQIFSDKFLRPGVKHMKSRMGWTKTLMNTESQDFDLVNVRDSMSPEMAKLAESTIKKRIEQTRERDAITQISNETSLLDFINDRSIPVADRITRIKQEDFQGNISDGFAAEALSVLNDQNNRKESIPNEVKLETFQRMSSQLRGLRVALGGTSDKLEEAAVSPKAMKAYREYKVDIMREVERGALSASEGNRLLNGIEQGITKAVEGGQTAFEGYRIQPGIQDVYGDALGRIDRYLQGQGAAGEISLKRDLFMSFSDNLGQFDEQGNYQVTGEYESSGNSSKDDAVITEALNRAIMGINNKNFVGRIDSKNPPNQFVQRVPDAASEHVFETVEQLEAANLPDGTPVVVGGVRGVARK